jgi:hypothetical protein
VSGRKWAVAVLLAGCLGCFRCRSRVGYHHDSFAISMLSIYLGAIDEEE